MTITQTNIDNREYTALTSGAALQTRPAQGLLELTGADRVDFIQRMTTNNIAALRSGLSAVTVLTSPVARILFVFTVLARQDVLWLLPAGDEVEALSRHLRGQIFFMDKVKVENRSSLVRRMRLLGPDAASVLRAVDLPTPDPESFADKDDVLVLHQAAFDVPGYELIVPSGMVNALVEALIAAGAVEINDDAYTSRRIELGRPAYSYELTEDYSPLEAGLMWTCAENKGCYTGQEIIARQITYDKVTRTLVGLYSDELIAVGADVKVEGRSVGTVTSSAYSPAVDAPIALAVVKRPHNTAGTAVEIEEHRARVTDLPFVEAAR